MSKKNKALAQPKLFSVGGIILFVLAFLVISAALGLLITLIFTGGWTEVKLQIKQIFGAFGMTPVWDFCKRAVAWVSGLFK